MNRFRIGVALAAVCLVSSGCLSTVRSLKPREVDVLPHAIFIAPDGTPLGPALTKKAVPLDSGAYREYLRRMWLAMVSDRRSLDSTNTRHLLIRIHGGLNSLDESLATSDSMLRRIEADPYAPHYFSIFINWEAGLGSSLEEHYGLSDPQWRQPTALPKRLVYSSFVLTRDLGVGIARSPFIWAKQLRAEVQDGFHEVMKPLRREDPPEVECSWRTGKANCPWLRVEYQLALAELDTARPDPPQRRPGDSAASAGSNVSPPMKKAVALSRFGYHRSGPEALFKHAAFGILSLIPVWSFYPRLYSRGGPMIVWPRERRNHLWQWISLGSLAASLGLGTAGPPAWEIMHRRTTLMFAPERDVAHLGDKSAHYRSSTGAASVFLAQLDSVIHSDTSKYEITLVGHSMGAIVGNRMLRERPELPWKNIVYMAAAATVSEVSEGTIPFLMRREAEHKPVELYNLSLHPWNDRREWHLEKLMPPGSLLEWIDNHFAYSETVFDKTFGKYENALSAMALVPNEIRGRVHLKAFGYRDGTGCGAGRALPTRHGEFNDAQVYFWRETFWRPGQPGCGPSILLSAGSR